MESISSLKDFIGFRHRVLMEKELEEVKPCLVVCAGTGGQASGSNNIIRIIKRHILEQKLQDRISLRITGCQGFCQMDPFIVVEPAMNLYPKLTMADVPRIIDAVLEGKVLEDLLYKEPVEYKSCHFQDDIPFFKKQKRVVF